MLLALTLATLSPQMAHAKKNVETESASSPLFISVMMAIQRMAMAVTHSAKLSLASSAKEEVRALRTSALQSSLLLSQLSQSPMTSFSQSLLTRRSTSQVSLVDFVQNLSSRTSS